jgi:hypothetical protein
MPSLDLRTRARAALIHLAASALIAALAAVLVFVLWYPPPYSRMAGGVGLFALITSVDVVMGPLITFAVFNLKKPRTELKRDLAIVVLLQLAALGYGLNTMFVARPVVLALEGPRFRVVPAVDVATEELNEAPEPLKSMSLTGPKLVRTAPIADKDRMEALERAIVGTDVGSRPRYWRIWDDTGRSEAKAVAKPVLMLKKNHPDRAQEIDAAVADTRLQADALAYIPVVSRFENAVALIDARSGDPVGFVALDAD